MGKFLLKFILENYKRVTPLTRNHLPQKVNMSIHSPFIEYYQNQALGKQQQIGYGFYTGLPWQKGYGIGGLHGSIARRFVPFLKPLAKATGKRLLREFVSDVINGKPVGDAESTGLKKCVEKEIKSAIVTNNPSFQRNFGGLNKTFFQNDCRNNKRT